MHLDVLPATDFVHEVFHIATGLMNGKRAINDVDDP